MRNLNEKKWSTIFQIYQGRLHGMMELFKNILKTKESCSVKLDAKVTGFISYATADINARKLGKWRKIEFQHMHWEGRNQKYSLYQPGNWRQKLQSSVIIICILIEHMQSRPVNISSVLSVVFKWLPQAHQAECVRQPWSSASASTLVSWTVLVDMKNGTSSTTWRGTSGKGQ